MRTGFERMHAAYMSCSTASARAEPRGQTSPRLQGFCRIPHTNFLNPLLAKVGERAFHALGQVSPLIAQACRGPEPVYASPQGSKAPAQERNERSRAGKTYQEREKERKKASK